MSRVASAFHIFHTIKWNECVGRSCGPKSLGSSQCFVRLCILIKQTVTVEMTSFLTPVEFHSGFSHSFLAQRGSSNTTATFLDSAPNTHSFRFIPRCRRARAAFTIIIDIIIAFLDAPQYSTEHTMRQCDIHIYIETVVPIFIISFCALALPNSLRCCSIGGRRRRRPFVSIYHLYFIAFSYYYYDDRAHRIFECGRMAANSRRLFLVVSIGVAPVIPCSNFLLKLCRRRV